MMTTITFIQNNFSVNAKLMYKILIFQIKCTYSFFIKFKNGCPKIIIDNFFKQTKNNHVQYKKWKKKKEKNNNDRQFIT